MRDIKRLQRWRKYRELGEPDEALNWCSKCRAHTYPGKIRVKTEHGSSMDTVCGQCKSSMFWLVPHEVRKGIKDSLRWGVVPGGAIMLGCMLWAGWTESKVALAITSGLVIYWLVAAAFYTHFVYWLSRWERWKSEHPAVPAAPADP